MHRNLYIVREEGRLIWQHILHTSPGLANTLIQANETEIQAYEMFKVARRRVVDAFGVLCVRSLEFKFLRPLLLSLDMLDDFCQNSVHMEGRDETMSKFDAMFTSSEISVALRQSVVEHCGVDNFSVFLDKVADIIGGMEWSEEATPIFNFGDLLTSV